MSKFHEVHLYYLFYQLIGFSLTLLIPTSINKATENSRMSRFVKKQGLKHVVNSIKLLSISKHKASVPFGMEFINGEVVFLTGWGYLLSYKVHFLFMKVIYSRPVFDMASFNEKVYKEYKLSGYNLE